MLEQLQYSFNFAWTSFTTFISEQPFLFVIFAVILIWSIISRLIKIKLKKKYILPYEGDANLDNTRYHIDYYKKVQYINVFGIVLLVILLFTYLLTKDKTVWTVFAVGIWAILLTFQTFTVSFFTYFMLVRNYSVGDTVRVGVDRLQGEILYIKGLYTGISGKNDFWEHTGEFYIIPNHQIWANPIVKVDLDIDHYAKHSLTLLYEPKVFSLPFDEFIDELEKFLNKLLPMRSAAQVSYYKSYIGSRYKIDFHYDSDGRAAVWIAFIAKRKKAIKLKKQIFAFIEGKKKTA